MTFTERAIKEAFTAGGYRTDLKAVIMRGDELRWNHGDFTERVDIAAVLRDPAFWKAFGNAQKWPDYSDWTGHFNASEENISEKTWLVKQHDLVDHLADEITRNPKYQDLERATDEFFQKIYGE